MTTTAQQTEAAAAVTAWLAEFSAALAANDPARAAALFTEDCFWRDLISFTWNIRTFEGRAEIARMLEATLGAHRRRGTRRGRRHHRGLDQLRDLCWPGARPRAVARRPVLDPAHHPL